MSELDWMREIGAPTVYVGQKLMIDNNTRRGASVDEWEDGEWIKFRITYIGISKMNYKDDKVIELTVLDNTLKRNNNPKGSTREIEYTNSVDLIESGYWREYET